MKRNQIILLVLFVVVSGGIYFILQGNRKEEIKESQKQDKEIYVAYRNVKNQPQSLKMVSYGKVAPFSELFVAMEVSGKLKQGKKILKPGSRISKGETLYRVDNADFFLTLKASKSSFATLILNTMPDIELAFPEEKDKWLNYLNSINPSRRLPEFPVVNSDSEKRFLTGRNILTEYSNLEAQEKRMEKYFFLAPFSGTVTDVYAEPESMIVAGAQIAKIIQTGSYEVKVPISVEKVEKYQSSDKIKFTDSKGRLIANGSIARVSNAVNQQTQSIDVYFRLKPVGNVKIYSGMYLNAELEQESEVSMMKLPKTAVQNNEVYLLKKDKLISQKVVTGGVEGDSVFVSGLSNGDKVLLDNIIVDSNAVYKGILR